MTFLDFPRLHLTGGVYKSVRFSCEIFSGFNVPNIIKLGFLLTELFKRIKKWTFFLRHGVYLHNHSSTVLRALIVAPQWDCYILPSSWPSVWSYHQLFLVVFFIYFIFIFNFSNFLPSVLWSCWLGSRKGIWPVKNLRVVGYWHGYLSGVRCRVAYGPADAAATHCLLLQ